MKSFIYGLLTIIILGLAGFYIFRGSKNLVARLLPSPSPISSASPTPIPTTIAKASPTASPKSAKTYRPITTTKGGVVKGASTTTTTTTTTSHLLLTLVKSSTCPISYMTEVRDIQGPLTLKYALKDGFSANLNIWRRDGNELIPNTTVKNSGTLTTISGVDYFKIRIESKDCGGDDTDWIKITAER